MGPRRLLAFPGFRRLLYSRFAAQWGDGLFQAGLAGAVVFNPERGASPLDIAAGFTVLLLPYSIVGPFAGALLDRWDRRRVLVGANLLRGALILISAACVALGVGGAALLVLALVAVGVSRFVLSGLSASLPHVVPVRNLVEANALAATLGAITAVIGGICAVFLRGLFGAGNVGSGLTIGIAVLGSVLAATFAVRFARGALGPDEVDEPAVAMLAVARGLFDGGRAALRAPTVTAGFVALFAHRAAVSISLLIAVLLMRYSFTDMGVLRAGMPGLGQILAAGALGVLVAGLTTARIVARLGRRRTIILALMVAAATQAGLGLPMLLPTVILATFLIIYAGQVIKLCVDAAVQRDVGDEARGRVFALYDTLFNITQVVAVTLAATAVPLDGRAPDLIIVATALYLLGLAGFLLLSRRPAR
ncbi:MAG TPA: MFS transporter [Actinophytocola sp.]|uniref:MFS transporter n=1 Tax=Actinophytocola sp. TaxID=1872138 RepID=UPI002DDD6B83|nr:MFS transporter [Actinophytocola sp.]HEV2778489.1 MFS transporter [Actinophytocola sp.]